MPTLRIYDINTQNNEIRDDERHPVANKQEAIEKLYQVLRSTADHQWVQELVNDFKEVDVAEKQNYGNDIWMIFTRVEYLDDDLETNDMSEAELLAQANDEM